MKRFTEPAPPGMKSCPDCRTEGILWTPETGFNKGKKYKSGLQPYCRRHQSARNFAYRSKSPGWNSHNEANRRARLAAAGGHMSRADKKLLFHLMPACLVCGAVEKLEHDHVQPITRGGRNDIFNAQVLCRHCNASKLTQTADYRKIPLIRLEMASAPPPAIS